MIYTVWIQNIDAIFNEENVIRAKDLIEIKEFPDEVDNNLYNGLVLRSHGTCQMFLSQVRV